MAAVFTVQFNTCANFYVDVTVSHPMNPIPLDTKEFCEHRVRPIPSNLPIFAINRFLRVFLGPERVPVKNKDYKADNPHPTYDTFQTVHILLSVMRRRHHHLYRGHPNDLFRTLHR